MHQTIRSSRPGWGSLLLAALLTTSWSGATFGAEPTTNNETIGAVNDLPPPEASTGATITSIRPVAPGPRFYGEPLPEPREVTWLGIATEEAPEVLTSQMNLEHGVGLVITFVAEESPAAKAGLERNDLLVAFDDQSLVHPAQLRKLVQSREEGASVQLTYYRNGKQQRVEVSLGKTKLGILGDSEQWREQLHALQKQLEDANLGEAFHEGLAQLRHSLDDVRVDQKEIQAQVRRAVEEARHAAHNPELQQQIKRALEEARRAVQQSRDAMSAITVPVAPGAPAPYGIHTPKVTIRSSGSAAQSVVQTDDTGTYVVVRNPTLRLTAHNHEGDLLFDGEIETQEQRASVPPELWEKVKPLVDKLSASPPPVEPKPLPGPPSSPPPAPAPHPGTI